ncbi:MAG TPA: phosphotransferase [Lachnospiraceae bacterium]|nr:phosphotransferase [Lachnospiraceae bacterium]
MNEEILSVLENWNLKNDSVQKLTETTWSIGDSYILKHYENMVNVQRNISLMNALTESEIPVATPFKTIYGTDFAEKSGNYYLLTSKLPGKHITNFYQDDYKHLSYQIGNILAKLHNVLIKCEPTLNQVKSNGSIESLIQTHSLLDSLKTWITGVIREKGYPFVTEEDLTLSIKDLEANYDELPLQLIHRDVHFGNFLFQNGVLSGYIDFDFSERNVRVFDIAYFLWNTYFAIAIPEEDTEKWYICISKLIEGYESVTPLLGIEKDRLVNVMECIELLFLAYFLGHDEVQFAKEAGTLYYFARDNRDRIKKSIFMQE